MTTQMMIQAIAAMQTWAFRTQETPTMVAGCPVAMGPAEMPVWTVRPQAQFTPPLHLGPVALGRRTTSRTNALNRESIEV